MRLPATGFLISSAWWARAWRSAWRFAPSCLLPSLGFALANILTTLANVYFSQATAGQSGPTMDQLIQCAGIAFGATVVAILVCLWALTLLLLRLTAFCRAFLLADGQPHPPDFSAALAFVSGRKMFLTKFWLVATVYLLAPTALFAALTVLKVVTDSELFGSALAGFSLPLWGQAALYVALAGTALIVTALSLIALAFSSVTTLGAGEAAAAAFALAAEKALSLSVVALIAVAVNFLAGLPQTWMLVVSMREPAGPAPYLAVAVEVVSGIVNAVLWPLSLAPFCQIVKGAGE